MAVVVTLGGQTLRPACSSSTANSIVKWNHLLPPTCYCPRGEYGNRRETGPLRLTQARIGDTLHDGNRTRVAIVNAFTTVNPETEASVRAVDYQVVGAD